MRKTVPIILACFVMLFLVGCGEAKIYKEATTAFESSDYLQTIQLLDTIPEYPDKNDLRAKAEEMIAYEEAVSSFQVAVQTARDENSKIDDACKAAQELLSSGKTPYDESTITQLQIAVSSLREMKKEIVDMPQSTIEINAASEILSVTTDLSSKIDDLNNAQKAMEDSIQQFSQVTNPTGDFIILRLSQVEGIGEIQGVTEEQDPNGMLNKQGGYTSATYFSSIILGGKKPISDGTDGGGCIEVFATTAEAETRNSYLAVFDGTGFASGSHIILGTLIIRTSNYLTATQQKELTAAIASKLLELQ